jgi:hypothetical protein
VLALPFLERLPEMQLGLAAMESNDSPALKVFRKVVMDCAKSLLLTRKEKTPAHFPAAVGVQSPPIALINRRQLA